jgi:hypothetical protein
MIVTASEVAKPHSRVKRKKGRAAEEVACPLSSLGEIPLLSFRSSFPSFFRSFFQHSVDYGYCLEKARMTSELHPGKMA